MNTGCLCLASLLISPAPAAMFEQEFEVASIRPSAPPVAGQVKVGMRTDGAQVHYTYLTMREYIRLAYQIKDYQLSAPEWLAGAHFDIVAKLPPDSTPNSSKDQIRKMLQTLLVERFKLAFHSATKEFPVYALMPAKGGIKMKESPLEPEGENPDGSKAATNVTASTGQGATSVNLGRGASFTYGNNRLEGRKMSMLQMTEVLTRFLDRPVVDMTESKATYDFMMELTPEDYRVMVIRNAIANGITPPPQAMKMLDEATDSSLFAAVAALGLKLEPRKAPLDLLVIDHIEKLPAEN
jgi:uncharacterized protein (TIGR03435 family)